MADAVVAPSRAFLADVLSVFPLTRDRAVAIHNGVDIDELNRIDENASVEQVRPYLLTIASHNEKKALDVLLRAFSKISKRHTDLRLLLVGDGPLRSQNEALAHALSVANSVDFLGSRSRAEVGRLLRNCLLFVLPSRSEPFGIAVAEALACGRPVVASSVGGIQEIIENERSGILVEPDRPEQLADAVLRVLEDVVLRERIANAGLRRVKDDFSSHRTGSRYEGLYSTLLAGSAPISE
jgi:glycosyltransferase involved in cell wall biosynthesis